MKNKEKISIIKMIEYIDKLNHYVGNYFFEEFILDDKTVDASLFMLSQIGELVKNISKETTDRYNNIGWNEIRGLRNRLVHDYEGINYSMVWHIIKNDIPKLRNELEMIRVKE